MNEYELNSFVDEIDHLTIKHRQGKEFDTALANRLIHRYNDRFEDVAALGIEPLTDEELASPEARELLVEKLVPIRDVILDISLNKKYR